MRILIVDDSPYDAELVRMALKDYDEFHFDHAANIEEFIALYQPEKYTAIISDYALPGVDTIDLLEQVRLKEPLIPFIFVSGTIGEEIAVELLKMGATDYVLKNNTDKLPLSLKRALEEKESRLLQKKKDEELRFSENLLNAVDQAVIATDLNGSIIYWNDAAEKIYGWSASEVRGLNIINILSPEVSREQAVEIMKQLSNGQSWQGEYLVQRKDGSTFLAFVSDYPVLDARNNLIAFMGVSNDITEKKQAENRIKELNETLEERVLERTAELSEANKSLEAFNSMVSHDLRSPARAVTSFASIIQQEHGSTLKPEVKELFGYIEDSGNRMNAIINDLLKLAKYGQEKLKLETVDMGRIVNGIWLNISRNSAHNATLELAELCSVNADMSLIQQVIANLLSNAIKYSSKTEKPVVRVWCEQTEESITFYFKDNGAGFDMKNYNRLFGAFQRLHNARDFEGTGVGLTLVKRIIEKHGGTVGADAKVGEGATFYFSLPG